MGSKVGGNVDQACIYLITKDVFSPMPVRKKVLTSQLNIVKIGIFGAQI